MADISEVLAAWQPYVEGIDDWQKLIEGLEPKTTGCGPVYELGNPLPDRAPEEFAIADMRDILLAEPHYHPNGETEIYIVLSGLGNVVVGGKENHVQKGSIVVTPTDTTHFTIPKENLVMGVINIPSFNPANYVPITESNPDLGFDIQRLTTMLEKAYKDRGLAVKHVSDEAGKVHEPDRDIKMHFLTLSGSVEVKIDDELPMKWRPFQELIVSSGQLHEAKVGKNGWEYIVAWDEEEAKQYNQ